MVKQQYSPLSPEGWMLALFSSKAARSGCVVRRNVRDVERYVGRQAFEQELLRRGYHAVENAGQLVIFCNQEPIRIIV
ncbi:N-(5'-phosphoribosyl)anthranilate isomerase [Sulfitobacter sp. TMED3]|uniref:N-(5'-phosphoribosyl)anthranilate isomerase n=1 Tax=Sulfitobacter sp. TMED3 TaxID=1986591 RepID=UPI000B729463|nr:N-(5'-phosphoribosyl)anthranilate isomerase [Sulfitobacter sp. TMED3]MAJ79214.1 N-(5'-phosphoribosyl)anthranilate isomerase [Roseobacter sp.]OUT35809.1 MAG: N-(5'-phosphoribosyl)anthranilate isomerase [Sulfitobacter sp. TMED3]|tara:strand:+ start:793 stop:1026 length:234 start_codon:yes stop_codon:yes gene_type:complete